MICEHASIHCWRSIRGRRSTRWMTLNGEGALLLTKWKVVRVRGEGEGSVDRRGWSGEEICE